MPFFEEIARPSGDRGPVEAFALAMLAAICAADAIEVRPFSC